MNPGKYQTAGAVLAKAQRISVKDQEVSLLQERVEDLETCIAVNMQLMQEIANARPQRSGEDTDTARRFPGKLYSKLIEQKSLLESAIEQTRAQKTLCNLKVSRSEADTTSAQQSELRAHVDIFRQIELARKQVEDKERTIHELEGALARLEKELQLCQHSKIAVSDLPGTVLRIERLMRVVRQDDLLAQTEKLEAFERCKILELQLAPDRTYFSRELHSRSATQAINEEFGLQLTFESYLFAARPSELSEARAVPSILTSLMEEAKREEVNKRHVKSKSEIGHAHESTQDLQKNDTALNKLEELFLASKMKSEEQASLRRLSSYLDSQKVLLMHKLQRLKSKTWSEGPSTPPHEPSDV